jgi:hypothetical protein
VKIFIRDSPRCTTGEERGRRDRLNLNRKKKLVED